MCDRHIGMGYPAWCTVLCTGWVIRMSVSEWWCASMWSLGYSYVCIRMVVCKYTKAGLFLCVCQMVVCKYVKAGLFLCVCQNGDVQVCEGWVIPMCVSEWWCASMWRLGYSYVCIRMLVCKYVKAGLFICVCQNGGVQVCEGWVIPMCVSEWWCASMWRLGYSYVCVRMVVCKYVKAGLFLCVCQNGGVQVCEGWVIRMSVSEWWCASMWRLGYSYECIRMVVCKYVKAGLFVWVYQNGGVQVCEGWVIPMCVSEWWCASMWRLGYSYVCVRMVVCKYVKAGLFIWVYQNGGVQVCEGWVIPMCVSEWWCASMWRLGYSYVCVRMVVCKYVKAGLFLCVCQNGGVQVCEGWVIPMCVSEWWCASMWRLGYSYVCVRMVVCKYVKAGLFVWVYQNVIFFLISGFLSWHQKWWVRQCLQCLYLYMDNGNHQKVIIIAFTSIFNIPLKFPLSKELQPILQCYHGSLFCS